MEPILVAQQFNECINAQNITGLAELMTPDHRFIDSKGNVVAGIENVLHAWSRFFGMYPEYRNTFINIETRENLVILQGYAIWKPGEDADHAIWTAMIDGDRVAEWRIFKYTEENRLRLAVSQASDAKVE